MQKQNQKHLFKNLNHAMILLTIVRVTAATGLKNWYHPLNKKIFNGAAKKTLVVRSITFPWQWAATMVTKILPSQKHQLKQRQVAAVPIYNKNTPDFAKTCAVWPMSCIYRTWRRAWNNTTAKWLTTRPKLSFGKTWFRPGPQHGSSRPF